MLYDHLLILVIKPYPGKIVSFLVMGIIVAKPNGMMLNNKGLVLTYSYEFPEK
jgi:hypothetical protein